MVKSLLFFMSLFLLGTIESIFGMNNKGNHYEKMYTCSCNSHSQNIFEAINNGCSGCLQKYKPEIDTLNIGGLTPLHFAALRNQYALVQLLVLYGLDVNKQTQEYLWTPLHCVCSRAYNEIILSQKAVELEDHFNDPEAIDNYPKEIAYYEESLKILKFLLIHGANRDIQDKNGQTPLLIAVEKGFRSIVELLLNEPVILPSFITPEILKKWCINCPQFKNVALTFLCLLKTKKKFKLPKYIIWFIFKEIFPQLFIENLPLIGDNKGNTPHSIAVKKEFKGIIKLLEPYEKKRVELSEKKEKNNNKNHGCWY